MTPVYQARRGNDNKPNCTAACLATLLEKSIEDFDDLDILTDRNIFWDDVEHKIRSHGRTPVWHFPQEDHPFGESKKGYAMAMYQPDGFPFCHSVVVYWDGKNYNLVHNPVENDKTDFSSSPWNFRGAIYLLDRQMGRIA